MALIKEGGTPIIRSNLLVRFDVYPRLSIIPISKSARSPLFAECESRVELPGDLLLSRCSAPLIAGISHRPSLQLLQKSFPEVLMVRPFLPLSVALSLPLFFCSRAENRICGVLVKKWERKSKDERL